MVLIKALVTGGTGFLGSEIVKALKETGQFSITAIDINPPSLGTSTFADVRYVRANILQPEELQKVVKNVRPDVVIHTVGVFPLGAARYSMKGKEAVFEVNVEGTRNVIDASKICGAKALVYTSSVTVVFDELGKEFINVDERWPTKRATTSYGQSKAIAENLIVSANSTGFATCALRPATIFGPHDPVLIPALHKCIARGETPFLLGPGTNLQDYVYVSNVADAHLLAIRNLLGPATAAGEVFFITNGQPITMRDLCIAVWKEFGHFPSFEVKIPEGLAWWMGLGAEWWNWISGTSGSFSRGIILDATQTRYASIEKAKNILGYEPRVSLPEALSISCQHFKQLLQERHKRY